MKGYPPDRKRRNAPAAPAIARSDRDAMRERSTQRRRSGKQIVTELCIQSHNADCAPLHPHAAAPQDAPPSERPRPRRNTKKKRNPAFSFRKRIPVSIAGSGRRSAGAQANGERNPSTALIAPGVPPAAKRFQRIFAGRSRRNGAAAEAGSASRRRRGSSASACHGNAARAAPWEENTRPWKMTGQKKSRFARSRSAATRGSARGAAAASVVSVGT